MAETLKEKKLSPARIVLIAFLLNWLGPLVIWIITGSFNAAFFACGVGSAILGFVLLLLCLPLGELMDRVQRATPPFAILGKVMDLVLRHTFLIFGWPQSRGGWSISLVFLAIVFLGAAVSAFFCATGNLQADQAFERWIDHAWDVLRKLLATELPAVLFVPFLSSVPAKTISAQPLRSLRANASSEGDRFALDFAASFPSASS